MQEDVVEITSGSPVVWHYNSKKQICFTVGKTDWFWYRPSFDEFRIADGSSLSGEFVGCDNWGVTIDTKNGLYLYRESDAGDDFQLMYPHTVVKSWIPYRTEVIMEFYTEKTSSKGTAFTLIEYLDCYKSFPSDYVTG